jgi:hypothetical protein
MAPRDASGQWTIQQSNGWRVDVTLTQQSAELTGSAFTFNDGDEDNSRELEGTVFDTGLVLDITWSNARGRYEGTFHPDGTLTGVTFDIQHPQSQATWFCDFGKRFPPA